MPPDSAIMTGPSSAGAVIRPEEATDFDRIHAIHAAAFPSPVEADLVDRLRQTDAYLRELTFVAVRGDEVVGHLMMSRIEVVNNTEHHPALALAPMAVDPGRQGKGIGSALVLHALDEAARLGHELVIVLGHPDFYPRFGFVPAGTYRIRAPFDVPDEVFMARWLSDLPRALPGVVQYPRPFSDIR